jgi:stress response protein SCP2
LIGSVTSFFQDDSGNIFGENWVNKSKGITQANSYSITMNKNGIMFVSLFFNQGIYKSTNKGESWTVCNTTGLTSYNTRDLIVNSSGHIFVAANGEGIFRSTDDGASWTEIINGITKYGCEHLAINSKGHLLCNGDQRIFVSTDNGDSWVRYMYGGATSSFRGMIINSLDYVYIAMAGGGVISTTDNGTTWNELNSGIDESNLDMTCLAIDQDERIYTAGHFNYFVYIGQKTISGIENDSRNLPSGFVLSQNYPNPFNPETIISYQIPVSLIPSQGGASVHVILRVYDMLGREVSTLVNCEQNAGNYNVNFNAAGLSSGLYIYRLQAGTNVLSRKMQLIR